MIMNQSLQTTLIIAAAIIISTIYDRVLQRFDQMLGQTRRLLSNEKENRLSYQTSIVFLSQQMKMVTTKIVNETLARKLDQAQKIIDTFKIDTKDIQSNNIDISENRVY